MDNFSVNFKEFLGRFREALMELCPDPESRFLCAFSGGADSTALLHLLNEVVEKKRIYVAHLDHGLRPESLLEAQKAEELVLGLGLEFVSERKLVGELARVRGKGLEEAARWARYEFLEDCRRRLGADFIVTAHQADDQAETIILKLIRGAGPGGLMGIPAVRGRIVRPLLGFTRAELLYYLKERGIGWIEDLSNADLRFRRNQVRQKIIPEMERLNPALILALGRAGTIAASEEEFWSGHLDRLCSLVAEEDGWFRLPASLLTDLSLAEKRRVIGRFMKKVLLPAPGGGEAVSFSGVESIVNFLQRPGAKGLDIPGGRRVEWRGHYLYIGPASRYTTTSGILAKKFPKSENN